MSPHPPADISVMQAHVQLDPVGDPPGPPMTPVPLVPFIVEAPPVPPVPVVVVLEVASTTTSPPQPTEARPNAEKATSAVKDATREPGRARGRMLASERRAAGSSSAAVRGMRTPSAL
jgi:hypothetical protein